MFGLSTTTAVAYAGSLHALHRHTGRRHPDLSDPNLPRENAIQIQVMLKGMGGFGAGSTTCSRT